MQSQTPRQVVFVMVDSARFDMLGCYGNPDMKTPNLDALAAGGVRFDRAYTCQPVCGPARSAIFTGMYPHSNGCIANSLPLYANVRTVQKRVRDHGIETAYIGKWHLDGSDYFGNGLCPEGCNPKYWYDMRTYLYEMDVEERYHSRVGTRMKEPGGIDASYTYGHRCTDRALAFLDEFKGQDFFLTVSYDEPHGPCLCPEPFASMYRDYEFPKAPNVWDTLEDKPEYQQLWAGKARFRDRDEVKIKRALFFGCNSFVDFEIGRLIERVRTVAPNALIVFTSDHGDMLESHCLNGKACGAYDEIARIPLIVTGPGVPAGKVCPQPVSHIALTPAFLEHLGIPVEDPLQGESLLPLAQAPEAPRSAQPIFLEFGRFEVIHDCVGGLQMMRAAFDGRYKLAIHLLDSDELYDLQEDPWEMRNLIHNPDAAPQRDRLHDAILGWMNRTRDPYRGYQWGRRPWRPDYAPATGDFWQVDGLSRQINIKGYEPDQLEYWTGLEAEFPHQVPNIEDPVRARRLIRAQEAREKARRQTDGK